MVTARIPWWTEIRSASFRVPPPAMSLVAATRT